VIRGVCSRGSKPQKPSSSVPLSGKGDGAEAALDWMRGRGEVPYTTVILEKKKLANLGHRLASRLLHMQIDTKRRGRDIEEGLS
jgi:hypothetical protein